MYVSHPELNTLDFREELIEAETTSIRKGDNWSNLNLYLYYKDKYTQKRHRICIIHW